MKTSQGFSLIELLITLVLVTSISVMLLQQQAQIDQLLHHALQRSFAAIWLDNNSERVLGRLPLTEIKKPFKFKHIAIPKGISLEITWGFKVTDVTCCRLQRELVTL